MTCILVLVWQDMLFVQVRGMKWILSLVKLQPSLIHWLILWLGTPFRLGIENKIRCTHKMSIPFILSRQKGEYEFITN
jgi:hypothetical protein